MGNGMIRKLKSKHNKGTNHFRVYILIFHPLTDLVRVNAKLHHHYVCKLD